MNNNFLQAKTLKIQDVSMTFTILFFCNCRCLYDSISSPRVWDREATLKIWGNYSSTFWDIAFTMTVIGHFQTFEKNSFNYVPKYLEFIILKSHHLNVKPLKSCPGLRVSFYFCYLVIFSVIGMVPRLVVVPLLLSSCCLFLSSFTLRT